MQYLCSGVRCSWIDKPIIEKLLGKRRMERVKFLEVDSYTQDIIVDFNDGILSDDGRDCFILCVRGLTLAMIKNELIKEFRFYLDYSGE